MQLNTVKGKQFASHLYEKYGSWDAVKKACSYKNSTWLIPMADSEEFMNDTKIGKNKKSNNRKAGVLISLAHLVSFIKSLDRKN